MPSSDLLASCCYSLRPSLQIQRVRSVTLPLMLRRDISLSAVIGKGHSHWQNTKDVKAKNDAIKSKGLSEMMKKTKSAVKDGFDPKLNKKLQDIMDDMKKQSLPLQNFRTFLEKLKKQSEESAKDGEKSG